MEVARVRDAHGARAVTRATWRTVAVLLAMLLPLGAAALAIRTLLITPDPVDAPLASAPPRAEPAVEDRTPEIRGRILDGDGNPVQNAAVRLVSLGPPLAVLHDAIADGAGAFSFAHVDPQGVRVVADHDPEGFVTSAELHAKEGQTEEVTLVLSATNGVRGSVVDGEGHSVTGATLSVEGMPWKVPTATSDGAGAFHLILVPDQATSLLAVARGYRAAHFALGHRDERTELVVRVALAAAEAVAGDVSGVDGDPVRAEIVACAGQPAEFGTKSAEDGTFELPPSTIGCEAVAQLAGFGSSDPVVVVEGRHLSLRMKTGGAIEGVVVDARGSGVSPFALGIESYAGIRGGTLDRGPRNFEDVRGSFLWEKLAPGGYVLTASVRGKPPARSELIQVRGGAVTRGVRIVVAEGGAVVGRVFDERHAPLGGVDVAFDSVSSVVDNSGTSKTDDSGRYRLEGAPTGPFTLRASKAGFRTRLVSGLRLASGGTLTQDMTLASLDGGGGLELSGIGASIILTHDGLVLAMVGAHDPAGRAGLEVGDHLLSIDGENAEGMSVADAVQRLRGETGTTVGVSVERPGTGQLLDVMIVRASIVR
jgi:hypothetical protein